jgi:trehalose/maltose transport system substrate-binding protein
LTGRSEQARRSHKSSNPPVIPALYKDPEILARNPFFSTILLAYGQGTAVRPSTLSGKRYPEVSRAYFEAVHAVLSHNKSAAQAAADLEKQLTQIIGVGAVRATANVPQEPAVTRHE